MKTQFYYLRSNIGGIGACYHHRRAAVHTATLDKDEQRPFIANACETVHSSLLSLDRPSLARACTLVSRPNLSLSTAAPRRADLCLRVPLDLSPSLSFTLLTVT
ncbi:hypothetical protein PMIN06_006015 [Paraphaeosphaeria minitans]